MRKGREGGHICGKTERGEGRELGENNGEKYTVRGQPTQDT